MYLNRQARIQLAIFTVITLVAVTLMTINYMQLPAKIFGVGRYTVQMELAQAGGLYVTGNVTYRGTEVGRVTAVHLSETGVVAELSLKSGVDIPRDLKAEVHSQSAIGEQYVELLPRNDTSPPLKNGDVIALKDTSVPTDINSVLDAVKTGLQAVPRESLKTVIDESYTAVGGLGPELSTIVRAGTERSIAARENLEPLLALMASMIWCALPSGVADESPTAPIRTRVNCGRRTSEAGTPPTGRITANRSVGAPSIQRPNCTR